MNTENVTGYCSLEELQTLQTEINTMLQDFHNGLDALTSNVDRIASQAAINTSKKYVNEKFDEFMKKKVQAEISQTPPTLKQVAKPVVDYIRRNYHPHVTVIIDSVHAEALEGVEAAAYYEHAIAHERTKKASSDECSDKTN